ncbi:NTF2 fold immunity protein [Shewanella woodyi]|uniref:NTF2 fold immunity protein n=1 Tax=Shewanella woodyi TaxID=60961 RepID=UPI0007E99A48|nr:NTF2 fold immunity protein [Shewanella woodyi]
MHEGVLKLNNFIISMNEWELESHSLLIQNSDDKTKNVVRDKLDIIFDLFCTKKVRKYGRQTSLSCGNPPEYSPCEVILEYHQGNKKLVIYTQQKIGVENKFRYTLSYKNEVWLVDRKESYDEWDDKWEGCSL